jgi:acyl-CoA thioester hydrolase
MQPPPTVAEFRVRYAETDQMGVVYHSNYLVWCEIGRTEFLREHYASYSVVEASGVTLAVAEANIRYHAPARYDDMIRVTTTLSEVRSRALTFDYVVTHAELGTRFASARTVLVSLAPNGRVGPLPHDFLVRMGGAAR